MGSPADRIETLREDRIPESASLSDAERDALLEFSDELFLRNAEYSDHRHEKLLRHCIRMAEHVDVPLVDVLEDRDAAEDIVRWINRTYDNEETNRDYRVALRVFAKRITDGAEVPPSVDWVSGQTSRSYDPQPNPTKMLHWDEHILPMIEATHNNRDAGIIAVAWDAGLRSGEFRALDVGDVSDHTHGKQVTVDGKQGQRTVTLIPSVPHLQRWLQDHPAGDDNSAPLWTKLHSADPISFRMYKKALEEAAERAGVTRPVTLTNFRKSSASHLASQGMSQAHIEKHHGWTRGSDVASRYISVFAEDSDRELARIYGRDVEEDEPDPIAPVSCPRCGRDTPRDQPTCVWCDQAIGHAEVEEIADAQEEKRREMLRLAKDNPEFLDQIEDMEELIKAFDGDTSFITTLRQFQQATDD
jgi:integrase